MEGAIFFYQSSPEKENSVKLPDYTLQVSDVKKS